MIKTDAESITIMAGSLALERQEGWMFYNGGDAPEGAFMGWLTGAVLRARILLPRPLVDGVKYFVFVRGIGYDAQPRISVTGNSAAVVVNERDANGAWTDRIAIVGAREPGFIVEVRRNPAIAGEQKFLFQGLYITTNEREIVDRYSTAIKLALPAAMDNSAPVKGNIVGDGGFHIGLDAGWGYSGRRTTRPELDTTQTKVGRASLKIPLDHRANDTGGDNMEIVSRVYHLKPNKKYTLSMWVKTSPGQRVACTVHLKNAFQFPAGSPEPPETGSFLYVTDQWQRMKVTGYALDCPSPDYQIRVFANELAGGYLWIDGIQLEEGELTDFKPASPLVAGIVVNQPANLFYEDEATAGDLIVRNTSTAPSSGVFRYEIYDFMNRRVREGSRFLNVPAGATQTMELGLDVGLRGLFRIVSWIDGMDHTSRELVYAVIPRPATAGSDVSSSLGIHPNYTKGQLESLKKLGIKWARVMSPAGFFRWRDVEPVEGQIQWFDDQIKLAEAAGITTLGAIGTNDYWPAWADKNGLPDLGKWGTFAGKLAAHYKSLVTYWEIWNEPHFSPAFYAQMLKVAIDAIEAANPLAKIVAMGGVPRKYMTEVLDELGRQFPKWDWRQHVHALSTHDYPDGEPPENFVGVTPQVWNTETGDWDRGFYQGPNSNFVRFGKPLYPCGDATRFYHGMLGSPNAVVQNFLRTLAAGQTKYFYYDSRAGAAPDYARSHTTIFEYDGTVRAKGIAYAIAGRLVDHSVSLGNVSPLKNASILVFDMPSGPIAALFSADRRPRQIAVKLEPRQMQLLDMMGNPVQFNNAIPFGRVVVYLKGIGLTAQAFAAALRAGAISGIADTTAPNVSISDIPTGPVRGPFRARWIAIDDTSYPNLGEVSIEAKGPGETATPEAIMYSYRLEGHSDWSPWTAETCADFAPAPGAYTLMVRAKDEAGNTSAVVSKPVMAL